MKKEQPVAPLDIKTKVLCTGDIFLSIFMNFISPFRHLVFAGKTKHCSMFYPKDRAKNINICVSCESYVCLGSFKNFIFSKLVYGYSCVFAKRNYRALVSLCVSVCACFCMITKKEIDLGTRN